MAFATFIAKPSSGYTNFPLPSHHVIRAENTPIKTVKTEAYVSVQS